MPNEPLHRIPAHTTRVNAVEFAPDGGFLVSAGVDGLVKLWKPGAWELFSTFFGHRESADTLSFGPDGSVLATSSTDRTVRLWSFPFGREERIEEGLDSALISPNGATVASLDREDRIRLWSPEEDASGHRLEHAARVTAMAFEPDGTHLVAAQEESEMVRWRTDGAHEAEVVVERVAGDGGVAAALRFFDGGRRLAASDRRGRVRIFETGAWHEILRCDLDAEGPFPLAVAPEEDELAVGSGHGVRLYGTEDGDLRRRVELSCPGARSLAYSPDGEWLAAAATDGQVRIWERT